MNHWVKLILCNGEALAFWCCVFAAVFILIWKVGGDRYSYESSDTVGLPLQFSTLTETALAFLDKTDVALSEEWNPFGFVYEGDPIQLDAAAKTEDPDTTGPGDDPDSPAPPRLSAAEAARLKREAETEKLAEEAAVQAAMEEAARRQAEEEAKLKADAERRALAATRMVTFLGSVTTASGRQTAYLQIVNPNTDETAVKFVIPQEQFAGLLVNVFNEEFIEVTNASGTKYRIDFMKQEKVLVE